MPVSSTGDSVLLGKISGALMTGVAVGNDQALTMAPGLANGSAWIPEKVVLVNPGADANGFAATLFTGTNQGGQTIAAFTVGSSGIVTTGRAVCVAGMDGPNSVNPNQIASVITANTAQLHVTHANASNSGAVDVYLFGRVIDGQ